VTGKIAMTASPIYFRMSPPLPNSTPSDASFEFSRERYFPITRLSHLLFGSDDFATRMGECIFDPNLSLHHFGRSCVQELYGWINTEAPVCNGRTVKALRYLGFDVVVF
jgi:hypothetical protein